ncbi:MAG: S9 family peptidase [Cryomorphaceae bacterium]|nr:S9 family peptidase [Flavobacteriales bacterium]
MKLPIASKRPTELLKHGRNRTDNYYWLNDRENPDVIQYLEDENRYADAKLEDVKELKEELYNEMVARMPQRDDSAPVYFNGYFYYHKYREGEEYPFYYRRKGEEEELLLNVNELAKPHTYYNVSGLHTSMNNRLLAFGEDAVSRRIYAIRILNLETGNFLDDVLTGTSGNLVWAGDNETIFYTVKDKETLRPYRVLRHKLGTNQDEDEIVYQEDDDTFYVEIEMSKSRYYIFIQSTSTLTTECRYLASDDPTGEFAIFEKRSRGLDYQIEHFKGRFYIYHNLDATNFKVSSCPVGTTARKHWKTFIAHDPDVFIEGFELFESYFVLKERFDGLGRLSIISWNEKDKSHYIDFQEPTYTVEIGANMELDTPVLRYVYTSLTTPVSHFDYDMSKRTSHLVKRQEVVGEFDPDHYRSERLEAKAEDGTDIPISMVYKKGFEDSETKPLLLYGYGSYGITLDAFFSPSRLSLLDRGFAFAIAHIRGGQEKGRNWYETGKLLKKKNTFTDFISCATHLIALGYTTPNHLYAMGGSAGGLLVGAVINMRPDLFNGAVAQVPFVDVVTTMLDDSIPLTTGEYDEWGNPNDPEYFEYILSYSPYDNVKRQNYPSLLVTTGLHDSQVQYWEPAKWVAKLRELKTDSNDLLLVTNMSTGHGGASGRFERLKEVALEYAFLLKLEN